MARITAYNEVTAVDASDMFVIDGTDGTRKVSKQTMASLDKDFARSNPITNLLQINNGGEFNQYYMKPGYIAAEDASTLTNSPVTSGAFYAYRDVVVVPTSGNPRVMVRITEIYPVNGRVWTRFYNGSAWSSWASLYNDVTSLSTAVGSRFQTLNWWGTTASFVLNGHAILFVNQNVYQLWVAGSDGNHNINCTPIISSAATVSISSISVNPTTDQVSLTVSEDATISMIKVVKG